MEQFINSSRPVHVIGAGLAGSEATWQLVRRGRNWFAATLSGLPT